MDNDDAAAATIAAVAAAAAASHQAQEHQQQQLDGQQDDREDSYGSASRPGPVPPVVGERNGAGEESDNAMMPDAPQDDETAEQIRRQTEAAAQQAVVAAAAAHRAHQEREQQRDQQQRGSPSAQADPHSRDQDGATHDAGQTHSDGGPPMPADEARQGATQQSETEQAGPSKPKSSKTSRFRSAPDQGPPKRRKINTCLQCKARKVKCDKARPLCGPCRKHGIIEACIWADEDSWAASQYVQQGAPSSSNTWPSPQSFNNQYGAPNTSGSNNNDLVGHPQAMIERIVHLEAQVAQQRANGSGEQTPYYDGNGSSLSGGPPPPPNIDPYLAGSSTDRNSSAEDATSASQQLAAWSNQFANASEAERGMAADALAMIAQHHPQNGRGGMGGLTGTGPAGLLSSVRFPFSIRSTPETLREAIGLLPTDESIHWLLDHVIEPLYQNGFSHCASPRLVRMQLSRFQEQRDAGEFAEMDASFLGLLFQLLVLGTDMADRSDVVVQNIAEKEESIPGLIELWQSTSEALLSMADLLGSANLNCLMALTAARHVYASQGRRTQHETTLALAITLAQSLGLHQLGSAREDEARWHARPKTERDNAGVGATDIQLSSFDTKHEKSVREALLIGANKQDVVHFGTRSQLPDRSHLIRETGRRIWYYLVCVDWISSAQDFNIYHAVPGQWNTAFPLNVDDELLPDGTGSAPTRLPPENAPGQPSDAVGTPHFYAFTRVCAEIADAHAWGKQPSYEDILSFDAKWRDVIDNFPIYLRLDGHSEHLDYVRDQEIARPYLSAIRFALLESTNHRLIVLHRRFLIRGHHDERYAPSVKAAVDAARMVIFCRQSVAQTHDLIQKLWHLRWHSFNAAMVLCMHLLELARRGMRDTEETTRLREEIAVALAMLDDDKRTNSIPVPERDAYATAKQIIARLVHEVELQDQKESGQSASDNNSAESLEGLYTHAGDTSEDAHVDGSSTTDAQHEQSQGHGDSNASTGGATSANFGGSNPLSDAQYQAGQISSGLEQLLDALLSKSDQATEAQPVNDPTVDHPSVDSSSMSDTDQLWRLIDTYAVPSFV